MNWIIFYLFIALISYILIVKDGAIKNEMNKNNSVFYQIKNGFKYENSLIILFIQVFVFFIAPFLLLVRFYK